MIQVSKSCRHASTSPEANSSFDKLPYMQTGDPTGTGKGGESIWGAPFNDEIRSTLRVSLHHPKELSRNDNAESHDAVQSERCRGYGQYRAKYEQVCQDST